MTAAARLLTIVTVAGLIAAQVVEHFDPPYLNAFIGEAKGSGFVASAIARHNSGAVVRLPQP